MSTLIHRRDLRIGDLVSRSGATGTVTGTFHLHTKTTVHYRTGVATGSFTVFGNEKVMRHSTVHLPPTRPRMDVLTVTRRFDDDRPDYVTHQEYPTGSGGQEYADMAVQEIPLTLNVQVIFNGQVLRDFWPVCTRCHRSAGCDYAALDEHDRPLCDDCATCAHDVPLNLPCDTCQAEVRRDFAVARLAVTR